MVAKATTVLLILFIVYTAQPAKESITDSLFVVMYEKVSGITETYLRTNGESVDTLLLHSEIEDTLSNYGCALDEFKEAMSSLSDDLGFEIYCVENRIDCGLSNPVEIVGETASGGGTMRKAKGENENDMEEQTTKGLK